MWLSVTLPGRSSFELDARGAVDIGFAVSLAAIGALSLSLVAVIDAASRGPDSSTAEARRSGVYPDANGENPSQRGSRGAAGPSVSLRGIRLAAAKGTWLKFISLGVLPRALPLLAVASTVVFSQWMYAVGAEFSSSTLTLVFMGVTVARQLASSWMEVAAAVFAVLTHHAVLVGCSMSHAQADHVNRLDGLASYRAYGSNVFEAVVVLVVILRGATFSFETARLDEREAREEFILGARTRHRRNVSQRVVGSMVPGPVADEMRSRMAQGLPPSLSWKFDMTCILQSDIVGFTRRELSSISLVLGWKVSRV